MTIAPALKAPPIAGRLAIRQALIVALIGLVLGAILSALQVSRDYRASEALERRSIEQMLAVMREPAAQASYHLNAQAAAVVIKGALSFAPVREAQLLNDFGETLAQGRNEPLATDDGAWWARFVEPNQVYRLTLSHGPAAKRVGELRVVAASGPRVERFVQGVWRDVGLSVLGSLVVALVLGVWFYTTLTRPLMAVARRMRGGPADDESATPSELARADEIGEITRAFERYEREARERTSSIEAAAAALASSELRHRRIVETAGEGVWQVDQQGRTTLANEAMAQMLGTTVALLHGRSMFDFLDEEGQRLAAQMLLGRRGGGSERHELRFRRADSQLLWTEVSSCPISGADGRHLGALAMVTDATERRRRDDELRASNAQLRAMVVDLERHKQDMAQIAELNELLQSAHTEAEAFNVISAVGPRLFAGSSGGLSITGNGDEMTRVAVWGAAAWLPPRYSRQACWAIRRGGPHLQGPEQGVRCAHDPGGEGIRVSCTPLYVEGKLLAMLHLADGASSGDSVFDDVLRRRLELFGEVIKLGLSNLRLRDALRDQALHDPLTGLANRRLLDETLQRELARSARSGQPLTVAIIDVDHFKRFNDHYGHGVGDQVLRRVAATLAQGIRSGDFACRFGGDEFVCLLSGTTAAEAELRFMHLMAQGPAPPGTELQAIPERVTFTVGLASAPESGTEAAELLRAADAALYAAKARGGHCVELAVPRATEAGSAPAVSPQAG